MKKILVIGLDCADPAGLLQDEGLVNLRQLMSFGCYGSLESVLPPEPIPGWMSMATGRDPGSLGVYGPYGHRDRSYASLETSSLAWSEKGAIWDLLAKVGRRSILVGVPPSYPSRELNGIWVGGVPVRRAGGGGFASPESIEQEIEAIAGEGLYDLREGRAEGDSGLIDAAIEASRRQFQVVRHLLQAHAWDYLHFVDMGLTRIYRDVPGSKDLEEPGDRPDDPAQTMIRAFYQFLDEELRKVLELLEDDTIVLVVSTRGVLKLDGGFCVNEWLIERGLLVLNEYPAEVRPLNELDIAWNRTRVWGEGGSSGRIFLNLNGREPQGTIEKAEYEGVRDEVGAMLEATKDDQGRSLGTEVFKPEEIYHSVHNLAPDLMVHFGGLRWRCIDTVGHSRIHGRAGESPLGETGPSASGAFILAAAESPLLGELEGVHLLDIAPTLLELAGYDVPHSMQGSSFLLGQPKATVQKGLTEEDEAILRERLSGLGYIS